MASQKDVKLLSSELSPFGIRCQIALAEKEVEYEYSEENLKEKRELLLLSNPVYKKIPVLLHQGKPLCESLIIVEYIDEAFPGGKKASILPSDPFARANARFWADFVDSQFMQAAFKLPNVKKGEELEKAKKEVVEKLKLLEEELGEKKYFGGEDFGFVDVAFVPFTTWFYTLEVFAELNVAKECPKIAAWEKRCLARDSVAKSLTDPMKMFDYFVSRRQQLGIHSI